MRVRATAPGTAHAFEHHIHADEVLRRVAPLSGLRLDTRLEPRRDLSGICAQRADEAGGEACAYDAQDAHERHKGERGRRVHHTMALEPGPWRAHSRVA